MTFNRRNLIASLGAGTLLAACGQSRISPKTVDDELASLSFSQRQNLLADYAVNLEMWWTDIPFEARFAKAAEAGFTSVEFWFVTSWERDAATLAKIAKDNNLSVSQIVCNAPALADRSTHSIFLNAVKDSITEADVLGAPIVTLTGHQSVDGIDTADALRAYQDAIAASAPLWNAAQIYGVIEPFNPYDHPGHFINGHAEALRICREIDSPFVKLNWDLFHMQRAEGNVIFNLREGADEIGYMQLADSPDRHQPGTGEMDYLNIIRTARASGYTGPIGLECVPKDKDASRAVDDILALAMALET